MTPTETTQPPNDNALAIQPALPAPERSKASNQLIEQLKDLPAGAVDRERLTTWLSSLIDAELARQHYSYDRALARDFAICGLFDDIKGSTMEQAIAQAMVKIQLGRSWGFGAADSMRYVFFTNGKPSTENEIVASKLQQAGWNWDVEWITETTQHKGKPWNKTVGCRLWPKKWNSTEQAYIPLTDRDGEPVSVEFTEADADHAQIWEKGKQIPLSQKWNFQSWGRDMYYWRCISRFKKWYAPNVLRGGVTREEAIETIPAHMVMDESPMLAPAQETPEPEVKRETLKDRVMALDLLPEEPGSAE